MSDAYQRWTRAEKTFVFCSTHQEDEKCSPQVHWPICSGCAHVCKDPDDRDATGLCAYCGGEYL